MRRGSRRSSNAAVLDLAVELTLLPARVQLQRRGVQDAQQDDGACPDGF